MKIAVACDHGGLNLKAAVIAYVEKLGHEVKDFGTYTKDSCDYPDFAAAAAESVASGECERGILVCSSGIGVSIVAHIKNTRTPFSIDFGVGDVIVPKQEKRKIPTQLDDFEAPSVNTYSLETTIAEKIDAILSLMEFSSRMKDYYDIYYLANKFDFDGATLTEALKKTFENRLHTFTAEQFEQVMAFDNDDAMQKKWKAFVRKIETKTDDFSKVIETINTFLAEPFKAAVGNANFAARWSASDNEWK